MKKRVKRITAVIVSICLLTMCTPAKVNTPVSTPKVAEAAKKKTIVVKEKSNASINKAKKKCWKLFKANRPFGLLGKNNSVDLLGRKYNDDLSRTPKRKIYRYIVKKAIKTYTSQKASKWFVDYMLDETAQFSTYNFSTKNGIKCFKTELKAINKICKKLKKENQKELTEHANAIKTGLITESQVKAQVLDNYFEANSKFVKSYVSINDAKTYQNLLKGKLPKQYHMPWSNTDRTRYPYGWQVPSTIIGKIMGYNMLTYHNLDGYSESYNISCMLVTDIDGTKYWKGIMNDSYTYAVAKKEKVKVNGKSDYRWHSGLYDYEEKSDYDI